MRTAQVKTSRDGATARPRPVLSTLDAIAAHPSQRFSIAISGSLFVHALIFAGWLSSALLSKPEILELREISYIDETELPPEEKAPEQELEVEPGGTDAFDNSQPAVGRVTRARGTISASEAGSPLANGIPAGGGEPGPPAPNVEELGVLKVMEGVAEVAGVSSEPVLHIAGAGKFLTNGHGSRNGTDIGAAVLEGFATGNGDGRGYGNGVDGVFEGLKGEIGGTGVKLGKVGRVTIERIGRITGSKEATSGAGGRSEESLRQVMMDN
ncbi:MAG: hypothetical protein ONB49_08975, partial [candidate division KSB1 bacterium]|nr:hypothetical protein [candidate division KSB1 bacterium]